MVVQVPGHPQPRPLPGLGRVWGPPHSTSDHTTPLPLNVWLQPSPGIPRWTRLPLPVTRVTGRETLMLKSSETQTVVIHESPHVSSDGPPGHSWGRHPPRELRAAPRCEVRVLLWGRVLAPVVPWPQHPSELGGPPSRASWAATKVSRPRPSALGTRHLSPAPPARPWPHAASFPHFTGEQTEAQVRGDRGTLRAGLSTWFPESGRCLFLCFTAFSCLSVLFRPPHTGPFPSSRGILRSSGPWPWRLLQPGCWVHQGMSFSCCL